jgi:hypothetical protein
LDLYLISLPVTVLPAHAPVLPPAGVLEGIVLVAPGTTEAVPFTGFFVMLTLTGSALQFRSHARSCEMRESTPDSAFRVRLRSWAEPGSTQIREAIRQPSETASARIPVSLAIIRQMNSGTDERYPTAELVGKRPDEKGLEQAAFKKSDL